MADGGPLALGFDIGGTNIRAIAVARTGAVGDWIHVRRPERPELMLDAIVGLWRRATERYDIAAIGVGCAGVVDRAGVVRTSPNIAMLVHYPMRERVAAATGLPVPHAVPPRHGRLPHGRPRAVRHPGRVDRRVPPPHRRPGARRAHRPRAAGRAGLSQVRRSRAL